MKQVFEDLVVQHAYDVGYKEGSTISKSDWIKAMVSIAIIIFLTAWITYAIVAPPPPLERVPDSSMSVEQMINHYETKYGKRLSDWRKGQIITKTSGLSGDEAWSVVKAIGDEI